MQLRPGSTCKPECTIAVSIRNCHFTRATLLKFPAIFWYASLNSYFNNVIPNVKLQKVFLLKGSSKNEVSVLDGERED